MPVDPYILILYICALASLARLVTVDDLMEAPRTGIVVGLSRMSTFVRARLDDQRWSVGWCVASVVHFVAWFISSMITCYWCASFWLALIIVPVMLTWPTHPVVLFVVLVFAMRFVASTLVKIGR